MKSYDQFRGNGVPRGSLRPNKRASVSSAAPPENGSSRVFPRKKYFSEKELKFFLVQLQDRRREAIESAGYLREAIDVEHITMGYGVHQENGTDVQQRNTAGIVITSAGKHGEAIVRAERMIMNALFLIEREGGSVTVQQAMAKLGAGGVYGICSKCHGLIPPERLEAVPHTTKCVGCKS